METNLNVEQKSPPSASKKALLIGVLVAIVLVVGFGTAYAKLDLFKSTKSIYLEAEANNLKELESSFDEMMSRYDAEVKPFMENPVHSTMELSNLSIDADIPDPQVMMVLDLLKQAKLKADSQVDQKKGVQYSKLNLMLKDKDFIKAETLMEPTRISFLLPDFYKKYGVLDLKEKEALDQKFGTSDLPKRFVTGPEYIEAVKVSKEEIMPIFQEYVKLYADALTDKQITVNKDATFERDGFKTSAQEITVTFSHEEMKALLGKILDKALADEKLFDLYFTRADKLTKLLIDSGAPDIEQPNREELKKEFTDAINEMKKDLNDKEYDYGTKMIVMVDSEDKILSRKLISTTPKDSGDVVEIASWKNKDEENVYVKISGTDTADDTGEIVYSYKATGTDAQKQGNVTLSFNGSTNGEPEFKFDLTSKFTTSKADKKETGKYDFTVNAEEAGTDPVKFSGTLDSTVTKADKKQDSDVAFKLNFEPTTPDMPRSFGFSMKSSTEIIGELKLPSITADNSVNLATATDAEMNQIAEEAMPAVQQFMLSNMQLFQELGVMPSM